MENPRTLSNDLEKVFNQEKYSDITLSVGGKLYPAHKNLLAARSDVFANLLSQPGNKDVLEIEDMTAEVLEEILRYIYTEKVERIDRLAKELLIAANNYCLEGLKIVCGQSLFGKVSFSNVLDMFKIASKNNADEMKRDIIGFIKVNKVEFVKTEAWRELQFDELNFQILKEICEGFCLDEPAVSQGTSARIGASPFVNLSQGRNFMQQCSNQPQLVTYGDNGSAGIQPGINTANNSTNAQIQNPPNSSLNSNIYQPRLLGHVGALRRNMSMLNASTMGPYSRPC